MTILPPSAVDLERALVEVDGRVLRIDADVVRRAKDPMLCPEELLPWLAWEEGVDLWDPDWPVEKKRQVIAQSWEMHRAKGSRQGLVDAINLLNFGAVVEEWFEYGGQPYHFRLTISLSDSDLGEFVAYSKDATVAALLKRAVMTHKNVRSHLETIHYTADFLDIVDFSDNILDVFVVTCKADEIYPWGLRYDGATCHDHASPLVHDATALHNDEFAYRDWCVRAADEAVGRQMRLPHDGTFAHNAMLDHSGWQDDRWVGAGALYNNERDRLSGTVSHVTEDRAGLILLHDAIAHHDAAFFHGHSQPPVADARMTLTVRRHLRHDGTYRHAGDLYDEAIEHDGSDEYFSGIFHAGTINEHLTA